MSSKLAIFGDIHLSKRTWTKQQDIFGDAAASLRFIVETCVSQNLTPIFLGDQFDTNYPPVDMVHTWYNAMQKLSDAGLTPYVIDGNHDPGQGSYLGGDNRSWSCVHPSVVQFKPGEVLTLGNITVAGFNYLPQSKTKAGIVDVLNELSADIVLLHQFPKQYKQIGVEGIHDLDLEEVTISTQYFCGHIHDPYVCDLPSSNSKLHVVGSTNPRSISELSAKVWYTVEKDSAGLCIKEQHLPARRLQRFNFMVGDTDRSLKQLKEFVSASVSYPAYMGNIVKPLAVVTYDAIESGLFEQISSVVEGRAYLYTIPKFKPKKLTTNIQDSVDNVSLYDIVKSSVEDPELNALALRLLDSPEEADTLIDEFCLTFDEGATDEQDRDNRASR